MIEKLVCSWCESYATHATNGVGDGVYPSCDKCCEGCEEEGCGGYIRSDKCEGYCDHDDHKPNAYGGTVAGLAKLLFK